MFKPLNHRSNVPKAFSFEELALPNIAKGRSVVMRSVVIRMMFFAIGAGMFLHACSAQDLAPRAYLITPLHSNAINLTYSFYHGGLDFNGVVPITGATGTYSVPIFSLYHSFSFLGRSANIAGWLPYGVGTFQGAVLGTNKQIYRSGLFDSGFRFSVNLKGGPAMPISQFANWKQTVVLGASLKVIAPTGQYDPTKLINGGLTAGPSNRSLVIPSVFARNGFSMATRGQFCSPPIRNSIRFLHPSPKPKAPMVHSKVT